MQIILVFPHNETVFDKMGVIEKKYLLLLYGDNSELISSQQIGQVRAQRLKEKFDETGALKFSHEGGTDTEYVYQWVAPQIVKDIDFSERHHRPIF